MLYMPYSTLFKDAIPIKLGSNIYYNLFPFSLERLKKIHLASVFVVLGIQNQE